jgi:hypothetical protein
MQRAKSRAIICHIFVLSLLAVLGLAAPVYWRGTKAESAATTESLPSLRGEAAITHMKLLFAMVDPGAEPAPASIARLRTTLWGGCVTTPGGVETLLSRTGFVDVRTLPSPPGAIVALIAARRAPSQYRER